MRAEDRRGITMSGRVRAWVAAACAAAVVGFVAVWFIGQQVTNPDVPELARRVYPGTWPPVARGILWLAVGGAAVAFDVLLRPVVTESRRGRRALLALAWLTGASFLSFAIGSFVSADWSVIH